MDDGKCYTPIGGIWLAIRDLTPMEAKSLATGAFGREFIRVAPMYALPLYWEVENELRNGTTFFLEGDDGPFGVTAGHVFDQFREDASRRASPTFAERLAG